MIPVRGLLMINLVIALAACSADSDAREDIGDDLPADPAATSGVAQTGTLSDNALTVPDLDAYERGVEAEIAAIGEAEGRRQAAATASDSLSALADVTEMRTIEIGARAAGMPLDRYRAVRGRVEGVLRANAAPSPTQMMGGVDTANAPPEVRAQIRETLRMQETATARALEASFAELDPQVAAALQSRIARLDSLRIRLVAERVRVAEGR